MIAPDTIEQVRQATDIVALIGQYVRLKRQGRCLVAVCPFHTEKTPSFSVSPDRQMYYCFGCQRGGTVFTFLQEHEGMSFVEAVQFLAQKANIHIREDRERDGRREASEKIAYANSVALEFFQKQLFNPRYRAALEDYLMKRRGITRDTIREFQLGLAGEEWDSLLRFARPKGLSPEDLVECGLALYSDKSRQHYDRFRQRLMIPIFNLSQKPIAFGGRTLKKGETVKYMNSPETALYSKGSVLYNLNFARDPIRSENAVFVVEGYFDVISLWQAGVKNVVASSGTAFSLPQARLLARFAESVYLFFDADSAGRAAALRSVDVLYDAGLEVKVVVAPPGEDPDSVARAHGREKIEQLRRAAVGYITYRTQDIDVRRAGIIGREKLVKEFAALGARIADPTRRSLFWEEAATVLGLNPDLLISAAPREAAAAETAPAKRARKYDPLALHLLSLMLHNPGAIGAVFERVAPEDFEAPELTRLYAAMARQYRVTGEIDARGLVDTAQDEAFQSLIAAVAAIEWEPDKVEAEARKMLKEFLTQRSRASLPELKRQLAEAEAAGDREAIARLMAEIHRRVQ